jgi:membrane associated rhomboid family serine protease
MMDDKIQRKISLGDSGNALVLLISANAILFVILIFCKVMYFMTADTSDAAMILATYWHDIFNWFVLPPSFSQFIHQPWSIFTYMFTHESFLYLLANMAWLAAFGYIMQDAGGNRKIIPLYLYGGFFGGLFFLLVNNIGLQNLGSTYSLSGAMPAVICVAAGTTTFAPNYKIFPRIGGGIPLWILFAAYMSINLFVSANAGMAYISTILFCALMGFFIIYQFKKGKDWCKWMYRIADKIV